MSAWVLRRATGAADETRRVGAALGAHARPGDVVLLVGGLGAGKTTFAQGFARALGVRGPVTSPTFTLVRQHRCAGRPGVDQMIHADLYRLESRAEVEDLALLELVDDAGVALVEWGDMAAGVLGPDPLTVTLLGPGDPGGPAPAGEDGPGGDEGRLIEMRGGGARWDDRRAALARALAPDESAP